MAQVRLYTTRWCGYCVRAKALLEQRGIPYEEISLDDDPAFRQTIFDLTGRWTVPQIFIDDEPIGGTSSSGASTRPPGSRSSRPEPLAGRSKRIHQLLRPV